MSLNYSVRKNYDTFVCDASTVNQWHKFRDIRPDRVGVTLQNQHATAQFWVADGPKLRLTDGQGYPPGTGTIEDIYADQGELWIYCDTIGAGLTVIEKFLN